MRPHESPAVVVCGLAIAAMAAIDVDARTHDVAGALPAVVSVTTRLLEVEMLRNGGLVKIRPVLGEE